MFNWLGEMLGINDVRKRIVELETRVDSLEDKVTSLERSTALTLETFGNYRNRTNEELELMELQVSKLLEVINNVLSTLDNQEGVLRARNLQRRLRNNHTRIRKAMEARVG